eukprot:363650_1
MSKKRRLEDVTEPTRKKRKIENVENNKAEQKFPEVVAVKSNPKGVIKHVSSGKYIHPKGGSANPGNNTEIVIHDGTNNWQKRLLFEYTSEGYIKHVSSGKYIHPRGGSANPGNDTKLVIHSGTHSRMKWDLLSDGRIKHRASGKWWHPLGGSAKPGNETAVCVHSGLDNWQSRLKWIFTYPDGEGILTDISFGERKVIGESKTLFVGDTTAINSTDTEQTKQVTVSKNYSKTTTWSHTSGFEIGVTIGCEVGVINKISTKLSMKASESITTGVSNTETTTVSAQDQIKVPPHKTYKATLWCQQAKVQIPYKGKIKFTDGVKNTEGIIETEDYFKVIFKTEEVH